MWINQKTTCEFGYFPVHFAAFAGDANVLRLLERYGAQFNVLNNLGVSPMHLAAREDLPFAITFLKQRGLAIDAMDNDGQTPLHWACF